MKLLIVEDDVPLARFLGKGLSQEQYSVDVVHDGEQARKMACEGSYDLIVLDLNLPRLDGISVLGQIRETRRAPVLILTGRTKLEDRIHALDLGADDCLLKPFSFAELSARIRALLRRGAAPEAVTLRVGDLELDRVHRMVRRGGKRIELTAKEFALLEYLMRHAGQRVTRTMILENVWNLNFDTGTNVVDVYVNERFYNFTRAKLLEAQIKMSAEMFQQQLVFISSVREAWQQVRAEQRETAAAQEEDAMRATPPDLLTPGEAGAAHWSA